MNKASNNNGGEVELYGAQTIFQGAFQDKILGLNLYSQQVFDLVERATFEYRYGFGLYGKQIGDGVENVCLVIDDLIEEGKEVSLKTGEAIVYGTLGVVTDRVFVQYGFPGVVKNESDKEFLNLYASYFSFLNEGDDIQNKKELCIIFESTKTFAGRKHIFEDVFHKHVSEYKVFEGIIYTTQTDGILRSLMQKGDMTLVEVLDTISHTSYNIHERDLYFDLLYNILGEKNLTSKETLNSVKKIIKDGRKGKATLDKSDATRISKTVVLLKIKGIEVTTENIEKHSGVYIWIPSIFSSTHGEDSASIGLIKGFIRSHRPKQMKSWDKQKKWLEAIVGDGANIQIVKKYTAKWNIFYNRFLKLGLVDKTIKGLLKARDSFGESKMDIFIGYIRKNMPNTQGELSPEVHKELLKQFYLIDTILKDIERDVRVQDGKVEKKPKSRVLKFILGRGKSETIGPFAVQAWMLFLRFPIIGKLLAIIPIMKFAPALLLAKTSFIYVFYKLVDLGLFVTKQIPVLEKMIRFASVNGRHSIGASPELQDTIITELESVRKINRDIKEIQELKKLELQRKIFETNLHDSHIGEDGIDLSDEEKYEQTLIQNQIGALESEIDKDELGEEIMRFKFEYLRLLQQVAVDSNRSFSDDYTK